MPVNSNHPDYIKYAPRWDLMRSVVSNDAAKFIRDVDPSDTRRNEQYRRGAVLTNFTALTKDGLTGLVFRKKPSIIIPSHLNYLLEDSTGENLNLIQLSQKIVGEILETGRYGILVDYPNVKGNPRLADDIMKQNVARLRTYRTESIINWQSQIINNKFMLTMVVLCEQLQELAEDGFSWCMKDQYRVLRLDNGIYYQQLYNSEYELYEEFIPIKADGQPFNEIPFKFIGSQNNNSDVDLIPLYNLAALNIAHYRNSADYEESVFLTGQPMAIISGEAGLEEFKSLYPDGIKLGSRSALYTGPNGGASLLQANPNQLADAAMKRKEEQALLIGARFIDPPGGRETAEGVRNRFSSQNSSLYLITYNISLGITDLLNWTNAFMATSNDEIKFELNDEFYDDSADANLITSQIMLLDRGIIAENDIRDYGRRVGLIADDRTNEEIEAEAAPLQEPTDPNLS